MIFVPASQPKRAPEAQHHGPPRIETLEATGIVVIAVLILVLTLVRYWHHIPWNAR